MIYIVCVALLLAVISLLIYMVRAVPAGFFEVESARRGTHYHTKTVRYPGFHMAIPYPGQRFDKVERCSFIPMYVVYSDEHYSGVMHVIYKVQAGAIPQIHGGNPEEVLREEIRNCLGQVVYDFAFIIPTDSIGYEHRLELLNEILNSLGSSKLLKMNVVLEWVEFNLFPEDIYNSSPNLAEGLAPRLSHQTGGLK